MKAQTAFLTKTLLIVMSAVSIMACSKKSDSAPAPIAGPVYPGIGANCVGCAAFGQGPAIYQGSAGSPTTSVFQAPSLQIMADATGYQQAASQGLRPLVNGTYNAAVGGIFRLNQPIACGAMTYPPGDYNIQMMQIAQVQNGIFYAPQVTLVGNNGVTIQPAAIAMIFVDSNLDNVLDHGSLVKVGFCGAWLDMNTL